MKKSFFLLFLFLISNGCKVQDPNAPKKLSRLGKAMDSWVGSSDNSLILSWGAPSSTYEMSDGGKVLTWEYTSQIGGNTWYDQYGRVHYNAPNIKVCKKIFYINKNGFVYSWKFQGC